jgi:hypothetical protein
VRIQNRSRRALRDVGTFRGARGPAPAKTVRPIQFL